MFFLTNSELIIYMMSSNSDKGAEILKNLFKGEEPKIEFNLSDHFEQRINKLKITKNHALKIMDMSSRTLDGILSGSQSQLDYTQLIRLSNFLGLNIEIVSKLFLKKLQEVHLDKTKPKVNAVTIDFINDNFDLADLKKMAVINSLSDYESIIDSIENYFGLDNILDYQEPDINISFSAGKLAKKNNSLRNWIYQAKQSCIELDNPYNYNRDLIIDYFPSIRSYSMDVEFGLVNVIRRLYELGITVVLIPSFPSVHIRGATFNVKGKPCIAINNYKNFYPTLWFSLIHELYHVLFDWEEILSTDFHISQESNEQIDNDSQNEREADNFALSYLFSKEKINEVIPFMNNARAISSYALSNHIDPSFIYIIYAYQAKKEDSKRAWARARKNNPKIDMDKTLYKLSGILENDKSFNSHIKQIRHQIYS